MPAKVNGQSRPRIRKRKARTEDLSSSSSSSSSSSPSDSDPSSSSSEDLEDASTKASQLRDVSNSTLKSTSKPEAPPNQRHSKPSEPTAHAVKKAKKQPVLDSDASSKLSSSRQDPQVASDAEAPKLGAAGVDFDNLYLRTVTEAFGNDLEKLRKAPDFKESTVPILIEALRQGSSIFSEEEKMLLVNGVDT